MRAAVYDRTGPAREVLRVTDVECPEPGPGEVRIRTAVSGVNPTDVKTRSGMTGGPAAGGQIPHQDGAGTIDAVGEGVDEGRVGQRVWVWFAAADSRWGTAAQYTVVGQRQAVPLPDPVSFDMGASLGVPAMTACHCLFADGPLEGRSVLVAGGAGAVGHFGVELARWAGARVATTVSSAGKAELATRAGAEKVVNYHDADAVDQLRSFAFRFDRIIEVAFGANLRMDLSLSGPGTTIVSYAAGRQDPTLPVRDCMSANVTLRFVLLYGVPPDQLCAATDRITSALRADALTPLPVHRFPLDQVVEAHEAVESGAVGKVVLDLP